MTLTNRFNSALFIAVASVATLPLSVVSAAVVTLIEAPDSLGHYAPVNFSGQTTTTSPEFPGITFTADSGLSTTQDLSPHAAEVGSRIFGSQAPGRSVITSVHAMSSGDYLNRILRPSLDRPKPPLKLPGKPQFVNASFTGSSATDVLDAQLLASTDVLVARDKVFFAAGAVTDVPGVASRASLLWGASNVLAVRGNGAESTFNPANSTAGRHYANVWSPGTASDATGELTSYAAALSTNSRFSKKAASPAMLRATLMASADRSDATLGAWTADNVNGLDSDLGAGRADLTAAQTLIGSDVAFSKTKNLTVKGPFSGAKAKPLASLTAGATTVSMPRGGQLASLFELESPITSVTAALTWDVAKAGSDARLDLVAVTLNEKGDAVLATSPLSRDADGDNVRFLSSDGTLNAGLYAWLITNQGSTPLTPGFAFSLGISNAATSAFAEPSADRLVAVPEPGALGFIAAGMVLLVRKKKRTTT